MILLIAQILLDIILLHSHLAKSFPTLLFQLLALSKPVLLACAAGASSIVLYPQFFAKINFLPNFFVGLLHSTSNPIGWLFQKFAECGEFGREVIFPKIEKEF